MAAFPCCTDRYAATGNAGPAFGDQPSRAGQMFTTVQRVEQLAPSVGAVVLMDGFVTFSGHSVRASLSLRPAGIGVETRRPTGASWCAALIS
jgi:hypothetical protein